MRRRSKRIWLVMLGVFVAVFLFSFLIQKYKSNDKVRAASLAGFDPGYIISDYQMGNYKSMSEAEIQKFLTSKNPCSNKDYNYYKSLSANSSYKWHFANGHFVCLSEEKFGDGEVIGSGQTAAHIIWQAAQDYKINPQVLIVLLQKETSLITDPIPNNGDYRKATGYGCPDTAACSSKYYGFKNQVRNAAALFRTVLSGGWTNFPLGKNYIQYNPNKACGGSTVNVRSLATSALYRYTPYQPNAGALAAGYGTATCGAYGNRNFYLFFQDWFGGITNENPIKAKPAPTIEEATKGIDKVYDNLKANVGKKVGKVTVNQETGIAYVKCEKGYIVGNKETGYYESRGKIRETWGKLMYEYGKLGFPVSNIKTNKTTGISFQQYEGGYIVGNDKKGYFESRGKSRDTWLKLGYEAGKLGFPKTNIKNNKETGIYFQQYDGGYVVGNGNKGYYESRGKIRTTWANTGFETGKLGFPKSNIKANKDTGINYQQYEGGFIVGNDKKGYYESRGKIRDAWLALGYEAGKFGFPKSNIKTNKSTGIYFQEYDGGFIVGNAKRGYYESRGKIREFWAKSGYETGKYGYPKSNIKTQKDGTIYQKYDGGTIYYSKSKGVWVE